MLRFRTSRQASVLLVLFAMLAVLAGCDTNDEGDAADFDTFERGDWSLAMYAIDDSDRTTRLNNQYETVVTFSFAENPEDEDDREFEIFATAEGNEDMDDLQLSGHIDIDADDSEIDFRPLQGTRNVPSFTLNYEINSEQRITFTTDDSGDASEVDARALRETLLPDLQIGDDLPESSRLVITRL